MDSGYPKHMEKWRGVPHNIDAATTWKDGRFLIEYRCKDLISLFQVTHIFSKINFSGNLIMTG